MNFFFIFLHLLAFVGAGNSYFYILQILEMKKAFLLVIVAYFSGVSCTESNKKSTETETNDVVKNEITIGNQVWMGKNLNVTVFQTGDSIPEAKTESEWKQYAELEQPAWCYYENVSGEKGNYGKIYNWYAINDYRGLAPEGWRIPDDMDWSQLVEELGGSAAAGRTLKGRNFWNSGQSGNNESGFAAYPVGVRSGSGDFGFEGEAALWWTNSEVSKREAIFVLLGGIENGIVLDTGIKNSGMPVRCIKD
jgi:uncharacterized protein (TIGR02145 family)